MKKIVSLHKSHLLILVIILQLIGESANTNSILSNWKPLRKSDQVNLYYRWVNIGDTLKTREVKAIFQVESNYENLLYNLKNEDKLQSWTAATKKCMVFEKDDNSWTTYSLMDFPQLLPQKDMLIHYQMEQKKNHIHISMNASPSELPYIEGVQRMENYTGQWNFIPLEEGLYQVEFSSITYEKPLFPRFLQDPIVLRILIHSLEKFINLSENTNYE